MSRQYTYTYDDSHRLVQVGLPSTAAIQYNYSMGRLDSVVTPDGTTSIAYDSAGRVYTVSRGAESATFGYDGDLLTSRTLSGTLNQTLSLVYDDDFSVESVTYAGATENFAYDDDDLITGAGAFTIGRNALNGLPESVTDGTATVTRTINGYGEVTGVSTVVNGTTVSWSTTLDNAGRITVKTENVGGTATTYGYTYDDLGHLETVTKNGVLDEEYTVDNKGRRTLDTVVSRSISNRSFTYDNEDRMLTAGSATYTYDDDGYLATKTVGSDVTTYTYTRSGALKSVILPSTDVIDYVLDAGEQRIAKKVNSVVTEKYLWAGLTGLLAVYDGSDTLLARFEYADWPMPVKMVQGGNTYYLAYDQVGSLRAVLEDDGTIVHEITYDSFGNILTETNSGLTIPFGFAGGLHDRDTGLVRFGYRDYDPDTGRWTAKDPIGFKGGDTNLYAYCHGKPLILVDSSGLDTYIVNRQLLGLHEGMVQRYGSFAPGEIPPRGASRHDPLTHTFVVTTTKEDKIGIETITHTYSWGNEYDDQGRGLWFRDRPEDISSAQDALGTGLAERVGDSSMDPFVQAAFEDFTSRPPDTRHKWRPWNNCKHEAWRVVDQAYYLRKCELRRVGTVSSIRSAAR